MKTKSFLKIFFFLSLITIVSCSKTEENVPLNGGANFETLVVSSDSSDNVVVLDEAVNFSVAGDDGVDYTNEATFFVNQMEITGANYVFNEIGTADVYASYLGINSNVLNFNVIDASERIVIIDNKKALRNQTVTFTLVDADGNDVTSEGTFYVDNNAISGNTFVSTSAGIFSVYADYDVMGSTVSTSASEFEVFVPVRKAVLEDYTGTWCGFCPSVAAAIEDAHAATSDIAVVAIHETANSSPDPYHFPQVQLLQDEFGVVGLPAARIDRTTTWAQPYLVSDVTAIAGEPTDLSIAINSNLAGTNLTVEVKVIYETGSVPGDKLVLYLTESGLLYDQVNYYDTDPTSPFFGLGNPIPDFEHKDVLRLSLGDIFGDEIESTAAFTAFTKTYTIAIPADYRVDNLDLIAMVVSADNSARNAQFADVNENKGYE